MIDRAAPTARGEFTAAVRAGKCRNGFGEQRGARCQERADGDGKDDFPVQGPLPRRNIDTGLGMDRLAMILQDVEGLCQTDLVATFRELYPTEFRYAGNRSILLNTADEVAEFYAQHTADTEQPFTPEAPARAFELTRGQPWLVNALARQAVEVLVPDRSVPVDIATIEAAKEKLILRRDTHHDSLIERLREPRLRGVIEAILKRREWPPDLLEDDIRFAIDLGLVATTPQGLTIANPIYGEVIPRA